MTKPAVRHDSFTLTREYPVSPERVFEAFSDPAKKRRWFAEGDGFVVDTYQLDFRVGGGETATFRVETPEFRSDEIRNDAHYFDIVPGERIVLGYSMSNAGVPFSASLQTVTFAPSGAGTTLTLTEQGTFLEGSDGPERRIQGTKELLDSLAKELGAVVAG